MMYVTAQEMVCQWRRNAMKGLVITPAYFFYLLLMAVQQTFLRAAACLPVGQQRCTVGGCPRAPPARPYRGSYLTIDTEFKSHRARSGKGLRCSLYGTPCSISPGKTGFPFSTNTVSKPKQNYKS